MSTNLSLAKVVQNLPEKFNPSYAEKLNAIFQFKISDASAFFIDVQETFCESHYGEHPDPNVTLIMDEATLIRVINGEQDGMNAFMKGQLRAEGDVMLATRLGKLFSR